VIEQIRLLKKLQDHDLGILELERERGECTKARDELAARHKEITERLSAARETLKEREKKVRKGEEDLAVEKTNLKKWKARLNESRNSRESIALAREVDMQEKANKHMEEDLLVVMEEVEGLKKTIASDEGEENAARRSLDDEERRVAARLKEIDAAKEALATQRDGFKAAITAENLSRYDFIRTRRQGIALAPAKDGICTGCYMSVSPRMLTILVQGNSIETCPSCQRIIYSEEIVFGAETQGTTGGS
jgi:predicted  nucleic acid-binding Zn-ribbon protein